jgi:hypothetical protein
MQGIVFCWIAGQARMTLQFTPHLSFADLVGESILHTKMDSPDKPANNRTVVGTANGRPYKS